MLTVTTEDFLAPISSDAPSGRWLRYDATYDEVQEARKEDADLEQGVWQKELKKADWNKVADICSDALRTRTKDLQLACWMWEAWVRLYSTQGLREGAKLIRALSEVFWDTIYPAIDDGDLDFRNAPFQWCNDKFVDSIKLVAVARPASGDTQPYSYADLQRIQYYESVLKKDPSKAGEIDERMTRVRFDNAAMLTPRSYYQTLEDDLLLVVDEVKKLDSFLTDKCGNDSPSFRQLIVLLEEMTRFAQQQLRERAGEISMPTGEAIVHPDGSGEAPAMYDAPSQESQPSSGGGPIRSRADAYRRLLEAAEYLQRTEPHSPTPYLVKRAVAWGNMSLMELLREVVRNGDERDAIFDLLAIKGEE